MIREEKKLLLDIIKSISYSRIIVDLRNKVIHAYDSVDDILIWKIIMKDIPLLLEEVNVLYNEN